ncbi:DUF2889 domain-containing protein [Thermodesulfobacteriota bacterium]
MSNSQNLQEKPRLLCNRKKDVDIYLLPGNRQYSVKAVMQDGVHHMQINMIVNEPSLEIEEISCEMHSVPDPICSNAKNFLKSMVGKRVAIGLTRELNHSAREGCTHLVNLFYEACFNITLAQATYGKETLCSSFPGLTEEQMYKIFLWFKPEIEDSCVRYDRDAPFLQRAKKADLPEGAEQIKELAKKLRN